MTSSVLTSSISSTKSNPDYSADIISTSAGYYFYQWEEEDGTKIAQKNNSTSIKDTKISVSKTVYAIFKPIEIELTNAIYSPISTEDLNGENIGELTLELNTNADEVGDFLWAIDGKGFEIKDAEVIFSNKQLIIPVKFTDQNQDGENTATITLMSFGTHADGTRNQITIDITANSDLTPKYSMPSEYDFGEIFAKDVTSSEEHLFVFDKNKAKLGLLFKIIYFNTVLLLLYLLFLKLLGLAELLDEYRQAGFLMGIATVLLGNIAFFLLDFVLKRVLYTKS